MSQAAVPPSRSTRTEAELPQGKKSCLCARRVVSVMSDSLRPCRLWPARLLCHGGGFSKKEYWSILANTGCHTLLQHYISCSPSCQPPWIPGAARPLQPKKLQRIHTWPSQVKPNSSGAALEGNPCGWPTCRAGNKTTVETQRQCG